MSYSLILPAIAIDKDEAAAEAGISIEETAGRDAEEGEDASGTSSDSGHADDADATEQKEAPAAKETAGADSASGSIKAESVKTEKDPAAGSDADKSDASSKDKQGKSGNGDESVNASASESQSSDGTDANAKSENDQKSRSDGKAADAKKTDKDGKADKKSKSGKESSGDSSSDNMPKVTLRETFNYKEIAKNGAETNKKIKVVVNAEKGTFPKGTTMKIKGVFRDENLEDAVDHILEAKKDAARTYYSAVSIGFYDKAGKEIEPEKKVAVQITSEDVTEMKHPMLLSVTDQDAAAGSAGASDRNVTAQKKEAELLETFDLTDEEADKIDGNENTVKFRTAQFTETAFVITGTADNNEETKDEVAEAREASASVQYVYEEDGKEVVVEAEDVDDPDGDEIDEEDKLSEADEVSEEDKMTDGTGESEDGKMTGEDEKPDDAEEAAERSDADYEHVLNYEGRDYTITVRYNDNAGIPEDAVLRVSEITERRTSYTTYKDLALDTIREDQNNENLDLSYIRLFDIKIMSGLEEIQPDQGVSVTVNYHDAIDVGVNEDMQAVHFGTNGPEVLTAETSGTEEGVEEVTFDAEGFSVYAIVYTVDFEYSVNGKMYQFSLPGGGFVSFTDLIEVLGIIDDTNAEGNEAEIDAVEAQDANGMLDVTASDAAKKFVADVASVEFSSPELVWAGKAEKETTVGALKEANTLKCEYSAELTEKQITEINAQTVETGDWALISVQPFTSEETLTVTMKDGEVFTIRVTDAQLTKEILSTKGGKYKVTVEYTKKAQIPEDATLSVKVFGEKDAEYKEAADLVEAFEADHSNGESAEDTQNLEMESFDISILDNEKHEVEPKDTVKVSIERVLPDGIEKGQIGNEFKLYHIDESTGNKNVELIASNDGNVDGDVLVEDKSLKIEYMAESFSTHTFTWNNGYDNVTVHYGYMNGNSFIEFSDDLFDPDQQQFISEPYSGYFQGTQASNIKTAVLIHDIDGYQYARHTYLSDDDVNSFNKAYAEEISPQISIDRYNNYYYIERSGNAYARNTSDDLSGKHIYITYEKKPDPEAGKTSQIDVTDLSSLQEPTIKKSSKDNGNGTNTLSLDITGAQIEDQTKAKADVIVIYDVSGSMEFDIGKTGYAPTNDNNKKRMPLVKNAVKKLADELMKYNSSSTGEKPVRMSLITFSNTADVVLPFTDDKDVFKNKVDTLTSGGATNWEEALRKANAMSVRQDADTYVIFVTDGDPTVRLTRGEELQRINNQGSIYDEHSWTFIDGTPVSDSHLINTDASQVGSPNDPASTTCLYDRYGVFGTGFSSDPTSNESRYRDYYYALQEAQSIVANNKHFYSLGISNDAPTLDRFTQLAAGEGRYSLATNAQQLDEFVTKMRNAITEKLGYSDVTIKDGITELTAMMGKNTTLWNTVSGSSDNPNGYFTYYRYGGENNKYGTADHPTEWTTRAKDGAGEAQYKDGAVEWSLGENFVLEDGVTYRVSFNVWPSQRAYDLIAGLNNGTIKYTQEEATNGEEYLMDAERAQIKPDGNGGYTLKTNTPNPSDPDANPSEYTVYASYKPCVVSNGNVTQRGNEQRKKYNDVDPMPLQKSAMKVRKVWNDGGYAKNRQPVDLIVKQGENEFIRVHLDESNALKDHPEIWESDPVYIATGLSVGGKVYETGHDYTLDEVDNGYQYELSTETVHPMLLDSWSTISFGQDHAATLTATNNMRGYVDINKKVYDTDGTTDISDINRTKFHFRVNLKTKDGTPIKFEDYPADENTAEKDRIKKGDLTVDGYKYPIWYAKFVGDDRTKLAEENVEFGIVQDGDIFEIHTDETFQLFNLPSGTQYSITEISIPGYHLKDASKETQSGTPTMGEGKKILFENVVDTPPEVEHPTPPDDMPEVENHKTIDYLGDGTANPDTDAAAKNPNAAQDLYRLNLDVNLKKSISNANIILVEDYSSSMVTNKMKDLDGKETTRYEVMRQVLVGTDQHKGFIDSAMEEGSGNQMTIISFSDKRWRTLESGGREQTGTYVLKDWTSDKSVLKNAVDKPYPMHIIDNDFWNYQDTNSHDHSRWTDYEAALDLVTTQMNKKGNNRPTYVIFLSDGIPTTYGNENQDYWRHVNTSYGQRHTNPATLLGKQYIANLQYVFPETIKAIYNFKTQHKNEKLSISSIGFADNMENEIYEPYVAEGNKQYLTNSQGQRYKYKSLLEYIKTQDGSYETAVGGQKLLEAFQNILSRHSFEKVAVTDTLSQYVELFTNQPDFKVTRKASNGTVTDLTVTYDAGAKNYKVSDAKGEIGRLILNGKEIKLDFKDDLNYEDGDTYTLSFNVVASNEAYEEYAENLIGGDSTGYLGVTGDDKTDYGQNQTSSKKPGFYSNDDAGTKVSYTYDNKEFTEPYEKPVIQVGKTKLEIEKVWNNAKGTAPEGIDEITVYLYMNEHGSRKQVTLKKSENWKKTVDDLIPKKLTQKDGKWEYVPIVYELVEADIPDGYTASYQFTATESSDKKTFTNMTSRYDAQTGKHIYYVPESNISEGGSAKVLNTENGLKLKFLKVDMVNPKKVLKDAKFSLYRESDLESGKPKTGVSALATITSGADGCTEELQLPDGIYYLFENEPPKGYTPLPYPWKLSVNQGKVGQSEVVVVEENGSVKQVTLTMGEDAVYILQVPDNPGVELPAAGGPGTRLYTILGMILILGAGVLLRRRRKLI